MPSSLPRTTIRPSADSPCEQMCNLFRLRLRYLQYRPDSCRVKAQAPLQPADVIRGLQRWGSPAPFLNLSDWGICVQRLAALN